MRLSISVGRDDKLIESILMLNDHSWLWLQLECSVNCKEPVTLIFFDLGV